MPPRRSSAVSASASSKAKSPGKAGASTASPARRTSGRTSVASTSSAASKKVAPSKAAKPSARSSRSSTASSSKQKVIYIDDDDDDDDDDAEEQEDADDSADDFHVDDNDDEDEDHVEDDDDDGEEDEYGATSSGKRKAASASSSKTRTPPKKQKTSSRSSKSRAEDDDDDDDDEDSEDDFDEDEDDAKRTRKSLGFVSAGIKAPTTGHVPAHQVSPHLFNLLRELQDPVKNDRDWFKARDKLWRYCEKTWLNFVETLTEKIMEKGDDTIPFLPPKDITYRIYRDVRFTHNKVPYKTEMQATFTRTGRKGNWAGYHVSVNPGQSFIAAGKWHPEKDELGRIRQHILDETPLGLELKELVKDKSFVKHFGAAPKSAKEIKAGKRQSLWGGSDQLKIAPKIAGLDPNHKDLHWLRLKSFSVSYRLSDDEVLSPNFQDRLCELVQEMRPLVSVMNRMVYGDDIDGPPPGDDDDNDNDDDDEEDADEDEAEDEDDNHEEDDGDDE